LGSAQGATLHDQVDMNTHFTVVHSFGRAQALIEWGTIIVSQLRVLVTGASGLTPGSVDGYMASNA
jgi:hypothetical protein